MKKLTVLIVFFIMNGMLNAQRSAEEQDKFSGTLYSQSSAAKETAYAARELELTDEQRELWLAASTERRKANAPLEKKVKSGPLKGEEERLIRLELRRNNDKFYETVTGHLTPAQKQQLNTLRKAK